MTDAEIERRAIVNALIDREQARFLQLHPRSAMAWEEGKMHFLYGGAVALDAPLGRRLSGLC